MSSSTKNSSSKTAEGKRSTEHKGIVVVMKYNAHCPHCNKELEKCITKYPGISSVKMDEKNTLATVEGVFKVKKLADHIFAKVSKRVQIVSRRKIAESSSVFPPRDVWSD